MAYVTTGLVNNGYTTHYSVTYDDSFSQADGRDRANGLLAKCEDDFTLMQYWFGGINLPFNYPIPVQIQNDSGGASWQDPAPIAVVFGDGTTVNIKPGSGTSVDFIRYLLVSEVSEIFMLAQDKGWFYPENFFQGGDEGSKGEGLSRFLGVQFQLANGLGGVPPNGTLTGNYSVTPLWLNSPRQDFVDVNPDDHNPDKVTGCTTLYLYYLHSQLGFSINNIIAAAASNLAGVYKNLTGQPDGWTPFITLVDSHYPPGFTYNPAGDNLFPVSEISNFWAPNQVTCGYSDSSARIFLDQPAMAEVHIQLTSDDPGVVTVPAAITVPVGFTSTSVTVQAPAIAGPFAPKFVPVHATYAGKTLTMSVEVVPPAVASLTLSPTSVVCGNSSMGTVTLSTPSLLGPVVVDLVCGAPGFATVPAQITIQQNHLSATFAITTPVIQVPFSPAHAVIYASYADTSAFATLTVTPTVIAGIIQSLTLFPSTVIGGDTSRGTVTLEQAVPTDTLVGLAAFSGSVGGLPGPGGGGSPTATVPPSVTIRAGQTTAVFSITTKRLSPPMQKTSATILAAAVVEKYALLTIVES